MFEIHKLEVLTLERRSQIGCGARQETQNPGHHGRWRRHVENRRVPPRAI